MSADERRCVVTGASSGIGYETVRRLLAGGARVFGSVRAEADGLRLAGELGPRYVPLVFDVTDESAIESAARAVRASLAGRRLSGLINNAAEVIPGPLLAQPTSEIREVIEADLLGPLLVTRAFAPLLGTDPTLSGEPGRVVMMSSIAGKLGQPFLGAYVAAKHGLEGLSETLRRELQPFGVPVIVIGPAPTRTPVWKKGEAYRGRYRNTPWGDSFDRGLDLLTGFGERHGLDPARVAETVWSALTDPRPATRYAPARHPLVEQGLARILPTSALDRLFGWALGLRPR